MCGHPSGLHTQVSQVDPRRSELRVLEALCTSAAEADLCSSLHSRLFFPDESTEVLGWLSLRGVKAHFPVASPVDMGPKKNVNSKAVAALEKKEQAKQKADSQKAKAADDADWAAAGEGAKSKAQAKKEEQVSALQREKSISACSAYLLH